METKISAVARAAELAVTGLERKKIVATLTLEDYSPKEIAEAFPATERKRGFRAEYFDYLVDELPSDEDAEKWIRAFPEISKNEIAHIKVRLKEAALARAVANR
jgi:hypothetical protein